MFWDVHVSFHGSRFLNSGSEICTQNPNETYSRATLFDFWCWGVGFHGQIPLCAFATTHKQISPAHAWDLPAFSQLCLLHQKSARVLWDLEQERMQKSVVQKSAEAHVGVLTSAKPL